MVNATYGAFVDWNNDGDFSGTGEDVSARFLLRRPATASYGRDQIRAGSPMAAGRGSFELNNVSGDYSPENPLSPLAGNILPARQVRLQATVGVTTYTWHRGFTDDAGVLPNYEDRSVQFTTLDGLAKLRGVEISTDLYRAIRTGEALGYVLDAVGWPAAQRDIDPGATIIRWWWEENTDAFTAVEKLINSEGIPSLCYIEPDTGYFTFRDRHHRLTRSASTTSQVTFRDTGTEPVITAPLVYDHGWRDVVNKVVFSVSERDPSGELGQVWSSQDTMTIDDGETVPVRAQTSDPFFDAVVPEADIDYQLRSGTVTVTLSRTQGASATIFVKAVGGPAVIDSLQLRAYSVAVRRTVQVSAEDTSSQSKYGVRSWPSDAPPVWAGVQDAAALAEIILAHRAERLPIVSITLVSANTTRLTQQFLRKLSDRVHVIDAATGLDADFFLESISHRVEEGLVHYTTFGLEKAATGTTTPFTFNVAGRGFNDGKFALGGLSSNATMFTFDVAGKGFDDGLLTY